MTEKVRNREELIEFIEGFLETKLLDPDEFDVEEVADRVELVRDGYPIEME